LHVGQTERPAWTCALLLFADSIFAAVEIVNPVKIGDAVDLQVMSGETELDKTIEILAQNSTNILVDEKATRDELLTALRFLGVVTRRKPELLTPEMIKT
nr:hypothetical protein [Tanacetum cinerariifolium]